MKAVQLNRTYLCLAVACTCIIFFEHVYLYKCVGRALVNNFEKNESPGGGSYGVIGIFSAEMNIELRNLQRLLFARTTTNNVIIRFLLDQQTQSLTEENNLNQDLIYLNLSDSEGAVPSDVKILKWFSLSTDFFPKAEFVGKMDDDVVICDPSFKMVWKSFSPLMYVGWSIHDNKIGLSANNILNDTIVILGKDLVQRISKTNPCNTRYSCTSTNDSYKGTVTLGSLLLMYYDIIHFPSQSVTIHNEDKRGLCTRTFVLHRKNPTSHFKEDVSHTALTGLSGKLFKGDRKRRYSGPRFNNSVIVYGLRDNVTCSLWGVITTIYSLSKGIIKASNRMCLVVVADKKTDETSFFNITSQYFVKFLSVNDQYNLITQGLELVQHIPWNHFGRKNIGLVYAIMHGAVTVFDFDDDNILLNNLPKLIEQKWYVAPGIKVFNPYPTFVELESLPWPRGFPLSQIFNKSTWAHTEQLEAGNISPSKIGVIQSLANNDPDVDAIWRLTKNITHITFRENLGLILRPWTMSPYNAQATLHYALWGMLLPVTVHSRVTDIWRSYITERLLWDVGQTIAFVSPFVVQERNYHNIKADFNSEIPLYEQTEALIEVLRNWTSTAKTIGERFIELYIELYERNFIEYNDVILSQAWIRTLYQIEYQFPSLNPN